MLKGTIEIINMLAKCLRELHCAIRFIATGFPLRQCAIFADPSAKLIYKYIQ